MSLDPFLLRALAAAVGVAVAAGPLGCFVVWRRMAYFGDSLAHSSLLGVALGLALGVPAQWGVALSCVGFAWLLVWLEHSRLLPTDALLGILAHAALAIGMVAVSVMGTPGFNVERYLFGDVLAVASSDLPTIYIGAAAVLLLLARYRESLTLAALHEDLAKAEGVNVFAMRLLLALLVAVTVSISVRTTGMLLVTSMLVIPAASARQVARSPEGMAALASAFAAAAAAAGVLASARWDVPSGPAIVAAAAAGFALLLPVSLASERR